MTEKTAHAAQLSAHLHEGLERYVASRRERIPRVVESAFSLQRCVRIEARSLLRDLVCNPINTLWAIPYLTVRKFLEVFEKLGMEFPKVLIPVIPRSARTQFQKSIEQVILTELFGLPVGQAHKSEFAWSLETKEELRSLYDSPEWQRLVGKAETDIRVLVTEYCNTQNGFSDLAASGAVLVAAQTFFGNRDLDVFEMGRRWAALWARERAESRFFLGKKLGRAFYDVVHAPPPTTKQVYYATAMALGLLALFSTFVSMISYPVQGLFGIQERQLGKLVQSVEDKLLLRLSKGAKSWSS